MGAISVATILLFAVGRLAEPSSLSSSSINGMLPFAAVLAIVALGQTLVIQQRGIDLSVPGTVSLTVVLVTHYPNGDSGKLGVAIAYALLAALAAGLLNGIVVSRIGVAPIVATLGMNALLYGVVLEISGGATSVTTHALASFCNGSVAGVPTPAVIAIVMTAVVAVLTKRTVMGRRFEAIGANPLSARASGLRPARYQLMAYVAASLLYCCGGIILGGIIGQPNSFEGDTYLLPSVAAVVLGGTSLFGGAGSAVASAIGALFLTQLQNVVTIGGANQGVQFLVEAAAIAAGVSAYNLRLGRLRGWIGLALGRRQPGVSSSG